MISESEKYETDSFVTSSQEGNVNSDHNAKISPIVTISDPTANIDRIYISDSSDGNLPHFLYNEAELELHEKQEWISRDVEALREMVKSEVGLLARTDKAFLLSFLRARKFDYEKALQMICAYYASHRDHKDLYFKMLPSTLSHVWPLKMQTVLSKPDLKGRTVLLFFVEAWNMEVVTLDDIFCAQILVLEHIVRLPVTQLKGVSVIIDCKGLSVNHIYYLTPTYVKRMVSLIQEVFPLRFKALHFVNEPSIFDWAFSVVKPFLSDVIKGRLHFHGENLKGLQHHFAEDILPDILGGTAGPVDNSRLVSILHQNEEYFRDHFAYGYVADEVGIEATEEPPQHPVLNTVMGMRSLVGNYYRKMCFE